MYKSFKLVVTYLIGNKTIQVFKIPDIESLGFYSQIGQDIILSKLFTPVRSGGFFVDVGAHNGKTFSNSLYFEQRGWSGICVEANPRLIPELQINRRCEVLHAVISEIEGECEFLSVSGNSEMLSTPNFGYNNRNKKRIHRNIQKTGGYIDSVKVSSQSLDKVFLERSIKDIDFISLDVEGSEMGVLRSLSLDKAKIKLFVVENNYYDIQIYSYFYNMNYRLIFSQGSDEYYVSADLFDKFISKLPKAYFETNFKTWLLRFCRKLFNLVKYNT